MAFYKQLLTDFPFSRDTSIWRNGNERHVRMARIKIITKFWEVFSQFEYNKNAINISSVKNSFKLLWTLSKPFEFIKWQENICYSRCKGRSHGHAILLSIKSTVKYEIQFLSSQRQKVLKLRFILSSITSSLL